MQEKALKTHFLETAAGVSGYGAARKEVLVAPLQALEANTILMHGLDDKATKAVILTDAVALNRLTSELEYLDRQLNSAKKVTGRWQNIHSGNFQMNFKDPEELHTVFGVSGYALPHLEEDLCRTRSVLDPLFRDEFNAVTALQFKHVDMASPSLRWHEDFNDQPERKIAVRCLSEEGTRIALGNVKRVYERDRSHEVGEAAHAGQGLFIMKGETVHASPSSPRWIYLMYPVSR